MNVKWSLLIAMMVCQHDAYSACRDITTDINQLLAGQLLDAIDGDCTIGSVTLRDGAYFSVNTYFSVGDYGPGGPVASDLMVNGSMSVSGLVENYGTVAINNPSIGLQTSLGSVWVNYGAMRNASVILNYGSFRSGPQFQNQGGFYSFGILSENDEQAIFINNGNLTLRGELSFRGRFDNRGQLFLEGGKDYLFDSRSYGANESSGTFSMARGSSLYVKAQNSLTIGTTWSTNLDGEGQIYNDGAIRIGRLGSVYGANLMVNNGLLINEGLFYTVQFTGGTSSTFENHDMMLLGVGDHYAKSNINGSFLNAGRLIINGESIDGAAVFRQISGETTASRGGIGAPISINFGSIFIDGGRFCVSGSVRSADGLVNVAEGATLCPGNSPGTMQILGNLNFDRATLEIEIGGVNGGSYDVLDVTGNATFAGGLLKLLFINGVAPSVGDSWRFLEADGSITGFSTLSTSVEGLPEGYQFSVAQSEGGVVLRVSAVPEPSIVLLFVVGLGTMWLRSTRQVLAVR